jgi:hypothetical protein
MTGRHWSSACAWLLSKFVHHEGKRYPDSIRMPAAVVALAAPPAALTSITISNALVISPVLAPVSEADAVRLIRQL